MNCVVQGVTKSRTRLSAFHFHMYLYIHTYIYTYIPVVQSLSRVWLFVTPMGCSTPGLLVFHHLPELVQTHIHWVGDSIQPSHPLLSPSPAFNLSQHQGLFQRVGSWHQGAKVLELQLQHQSFQWIFRIDWFDLLSVQGILKSLLQHWKWLVF